MFFEIIGELSEIETIASGRGIKEIARLRKVYGRGNWRKRKGIATVMLADDTIHTAEVHWYEATGLGKKEFKIKQFRD
jgi:predicted phosphoribosyltransferase